MRDSRIAKNPGAGKVTEKELRALAVKWGTLPEKERAEAMQGLTRDMPPKYREVIQNYFKELGKNSDANK